MGWLDLWLLVLLVPALAAGVWCLRRWKGYGLIPAAVLGLLAFVAGPYCRLYLQKYLDLFVSSRLPERALIWLVAAAATLVASASLWAGYSRGYWFLRVTAVAGILALLATLDAKEPVLFCLITMPAIAGGAWLIRRYQDRVQKLEAVQAGERQIKQSRWRWSLRDALLAFVIVGCWPRRCDL